MGQAQSPHKDLGGQEAIEKIKKLTEKAGICFFTTKVGKDAHSIPMSLQAADEDGTLWFISAIDSTHNQNILQDPTVQLYFPNMFSLKEQRRSLKIALLSMSITASLPMLGLREKMIHV